MRRVRRVRTSTWVLTAVFLVALAAYLWLGPDTAATRIPEKTPAHPAGSSTAVPSTFRPTTKPSPTPRVTPATPVPTTSAPRLSRTPHPTVAPTASSSTLGDTIPVSHRLHVPLAREGARARGSGQRPIMPTARLSAWSAERGWPRH